MVTKEDIKKLEKALYDAKKVYKKAYEARDKAEKAYADAWKAYKDTLEAYDKAETEYQRALDESEAKKG